MVREPDATMQPAPQDIQLMSKHRVLSLKPQLRLEWRGQDGQNETEQRDHCASLGDSITTSTRMMVSVHTSGNHLTTNLLERILYGSIEPFPSEFVHRKRPLRIPNQTCAVAAGTDFKPESGL